MGGSNSSADKVDMQADLERIAREKEQKELERIAREKVPPIGLTVQREDGQPEVEVEVRPWELVHGSLDKALELDNTRKVTEAWLGELRLEGEGSWESQGVVDGAAVRAVVEEKTALIVVADSDNHQVQVFRLEDGSHVRSIGSKGSGPGQFDGPEGVAVDGQGHLIVADTFNHRVQVFRLEDGSFVRSIGSEGSGPGEFKEPNGVAVDGEGHLIVADFYNHRVQVLRLEDGSHVRSIGKEGEGPWEWEGEGPGEFKGPCGVAVDGHGHLIVADTSNHRVQVLRLEDGSHVRTIGCKGSGREPGRCGGPSVYFFFPEGVAVDREGHLIVADRSNDRVQVLRLEDGSRVQTIPYHGSQGKGPGEFNRPRGVAVDGQGHLIVADTKNHRVQVLRLEDGSHVRSIGSEGSEPGQFKGPQGVAVDFF